MATPGMLTPVLDVPLMNLGSLRQLDVEDVLGQPDGQPLHVQWKVESGKHHARFSSLSPHGLVLGLCDEERTYEYYEDTRHELRVIDPLSGELRLTRPGEWPVVVSGALLLSLEWQGPRARRQLRARDLRSLELLFELPIPARADTFAPAPDGIYLWNHEAHYSGAPFELMFCPLSEDNGLHPEAMASVPIHADRPINMLRASARHLLVGQWDRQLRVPTVLSIRDRVTGAEVWQKTVTRSSPYEVLLDEHGWLDFDERAVTGFGPDGTVRLQGPGLRRAWMTSRWVVGELSGLAQYEARERCRAESRPYQHGLVLLDRLTGAQQLMEWVGRPYESYSWDVVIAGNTSWQLLRNEKELWGFGVEADGTVRLLCRMPQPSLSVYGVDRLYAWEKGLVGVSDEGNVIRLVGE